jgi:hypothetical protein
MAAPSSKTLKDLSGKWVMVSQLAFSQFKLQAISAKPAQKL